MFPSPFSNKCKPLEQAFPSTSQPNTLWHEVTAPSRSHLSTIPMLSSAPTSFIHHPLTSNNLKRTTVIIDGSNVAMSHGGHKVFSWKGIETCVQFFQQKGNPVYVVVPQWRKSCHPAPAKEQNMRIIASLEQQGLMAWTPSRQIGLRMTSSYDDPFILKYAEKTNGVVVSNDYFRDVLQKCPQFREIIEERTLMYTFFENAFYLPADQQGRYTKLSTEALLNGTPDGWMGGMTPEAPMECEAVASEHGKQPPSRLTFSSSPEKATVTLTKTAKARLKQKNLQQLKKKSKEKSAFSKSLPAKERSAAKVETFGSSGDGWKSPYTVLPMSKTARRFLLTTSPAITTAVSKTDGSIDWICVICMKKFRDERFLLGHLDSMRHRQLLTENVTATEDFCNEVVGKVFSAGTGLFPASVADTELTSMPHEIRALDEQI